ncbi:energy-coupling factor transporter transmembrane component T family protein [Numidum massiliense]|uniref:energy-coupling factor transporter transmembrane component T family protein n=1 Tax=Numidum massiliense TaxID=1522315 RepID=UPI0006D55FA4|nr:energy-coupling factor transporter transmembrane component T [Numidum massiliense]
MKFASLYVERESLIHRVDPVNKLWYAVAALVVAFLVPTLTGLIACTLVSISLLFVGKVFKRSLPMFGFVFLILLTVVIIQGLFYPGNETVSFTIGPMKFYVEGLTFATVITLRVVTIVSAFSLLVLTTPPPELVEALVRRGLSPRFGYVIGSVFQIVPEMMATMATITDAQRSRGMETEGSLRVRMKAFFPLIGPVVLNSLISVKERSMALEVRGFNAQGEKTFLNEERQYIATRAIRWSMWAVIVLAVVWRIVQ